MIEFKRNKKTGILEAWKDGEKVGEVKTMGDDLNEQLRNKTDGQQSAN